MLIYANTRNDFCIGLNPTQGFFILPIGIDIVLVHSFENSPLKCL